MNARKNISGSAGQEVNLKSFFQKVYKHRLLFIASICSFVVLALLYVAIATPIYEVSTSLLIDSSGRNRVLGESQYVEGGVSLIEMEKNLYNEIGVIKSYSLINQTVEDLKLDVTYHTSGVLNDEEHYGYFPFKVHLIRSKPQLYNVPFEIKMLSGDRYVLTVEADDFMVSNPANGSAREVSRNLEFSEAFKFGDQINHEYFTFILEKPDYKVNSVDFEGKNLNFVVHNTDAVTKNYMSDLEVNNIDIEASIFKIVTSGPIVEKKIDFLKKLTDNYVENELASRNKIASGKETFIRNQLRLISDSLSNTEMDLEAFKRDKQAVDLSTTATNALDQTQELQVERAKLRLDIKYYNSLIRNIENNRGREDFVIPTVTGIDDRLLNENLLELQRLYAERSKKKFFVTSNNQEMNILNKQIAEATDLLLDNLRNAISSARFELQRVNSQLANFNEEISSLPMRENQLLSIQRQSTLYENLFNYLSQELAKTGIARAESTSDTRVLDEARMVGDGPVAPQKMLLIVVAITLGILFPLGWLVLSPDNRIESIHQILANTDLPVIASIVHHETKPREAGWEEEILSKTKQSFRNISDHLKLFEVQTHNGGEKDGELDVALWKLKESFRYLATNLKLINSGNDRVIGITSIMPEEGKTYNAVNLGITLAESGYKTIIIDTDLRKPSLVKKPNDIAVYGLSHYLQGEIESAHEIIHTHDTLDNLDYIATSVVNGNVHGLLSSPKLKNLIVQLRKEYDYVVLDTPAVGLVSDFLLLTDIIDINLFVVRRNIAKIQFLKDIEDLIPKNKKKKSCIVFNAVPMKGHRYGYEEKYGINNEEQLVKESLS